MDVSHFSKDYKGSAGKEIFAFSGDPRLFFCQKNRDWRVREVFICA